MWNHCILFSYSYIIAVILNFWVILQGSAATYLRCKIKYYVFLVANFVLFPAVKNFVSRSKFDRIGGKKERGSHFFGPLCKLDISVLYRTMSCCNGCKMWSQLNLILRGLSVVYRLHVHTSQWRLSLVNSLRSSTDQYWLRGTSRQRPAKNSTKWTTSDLTGTQYFHQFCQLTFKFDVLQSKQHKWHWKVQPQA